MSGSTPAASLEPKEIPPEIRARLQQLDEERLAILQSLRSSAVSAGSTPAPGKLPPLDVSGIRDGEGLPQVDRPDEPGGLGDKDEDEVAFGYAFRPDELEIASSRRRRQSGLAAGMGRTNDGVRIVSTGVQADWPPAGYRADEMSPCSNDISSQRSVLPPGEHSAARVFGMPLPSAPMLEPRGITFRVVDPNDSLIEMASFDDLCAVLHHRKNTMPRSIALLVLDAKGKEAVSISWEKLESKAEKVAQIIREKSGLYKGDRVTLVYRDCEIVDFAVSLFGCFIAGVAAVPICNFNDFAAMDFILSTTQTHLALTTDYNLRTIQRHLIERKLPWPKGVEWWKTNEFGSYHSKKENSSKQAKHEIAYIEFTKAPTGEYHGVVISHLTIMHQLAVLAAAILSAPKHEKDEPVDSRSPSIRGDAMASYLDPRSGMGLISNIFLTVYTGLTNVWLPTEITTIAGMYANIITRYKATIIFGDYPGLKTVAYNYQYDPLATRNFSKRSPVDLSSVRLCLIECLTVDAEFTEVLADRWFRPLGNTRARQIIAPMFCLPEHGGMVIALRDWLGGQDRLTKDGSIAETYLDELPEALIEKEPLKTNDVVVVAKGELARKRVGESNTLRVGAFGFPVADATLAVVNPENMVICADNIVGEIWVDSPSLSGGFWALPKQTANIFHAKPISIECDGRFIERDQEFLRTGFLGFLIDGRVYVLGLYEDRLRQKVEWVDDDQQAEGCVEYRYHYTTHLIKTVLTRVPKIFDCAAFDVNVNDEYLPVVLLETLEAEEHVDAAGERQEINIALLNQLAAKTFECLLEEHQVRVFCVLATKPHGLPRATKSGRTEIGNMICRKQFEQGALPCTFVRFAPKHTVLNLPIGEDPVGGMWSPYAASQRKAILLSEVKQYTGLDRRDFSPDEKTRLDLADVRCLMDFIQLRANRHPEDVAYTTIDARGREGKTLTWRKLDQKIAAVAIHLKNKYRLQPKDHVIMIFTHSEEYVYVMHACFVLGLIPTPLPPLDPSRLHEDAPALLNIISDIGTRAILVNNESEHLLKSKSTWQHLKQSAAATRLRLPPIYNCSKVSKQSRGTKELGLKMDVTLLNSQESALIWCYWSPDHRRTTVALSHRDMLAICKIQKETCHISSSRPLIGCLNCYSGLGFIYTCLLGIFIGTTTYILSHADLALNPILLLGALARLKIKDIYTTSQLMDYIMSIPVKGFNLHEIKNIMVAFDGRVRKDLYRRVLRHFTGSSLDSLALNATYSHHLNPLVATRAYMCVEPITVALDAKALRRGFVIPTALEHDPFALLLHDSGTIPVCSRIAIVNPETGELCPSGQYGEIWIASEGNVLGYYGSKEAYETEIMRAYIVDGDHTTAYARTGDLGFLYEFMRPVGPGGALSEMQSLFVLGSIGDTFEVNGLTYFPIDIECVIERSHRQIAQNGCAIFHAGTQTVAICEVVGHHAYLASLVPVIVNTALNEFQLLIEIVTFVSQGDFPRSRLGEKQRGKLLGSWVTRRLPIITQFNVSEREDIMPCPLNYRHSSSSSQMLNRLQSRHSLGEIPGVHRRGLNHQRTTSSLSALQRSEDSGRKPKMLGH